jgi:nitrogen fixation/metabolism regulation signal transduction histidine kinase
MPASQTLESDHRDSFIQILFDKSLAGLLLLDQGRVIICNPAASRALSLNGNAFGNPLRIDGPDGPLWDRIMESTRGSGVFDYHMPANDERGEYTLQLSVVQLDGGKMLLQVDDVTSTRRLQSRWEDSVGHAFHELKTPLAVFSLGLSNLSFYYERLTDEQRRSTIDDLAEQAREMTEVLAELFGQMRGTSAPGK